MFKLLEKNNDSNDFSTNEYLQEVRIIANKDNMDIFILKTNKYIYQVKIPYINRYTDEYGYIHSYKDYGVSHNCNNNIMGICRKYYINTRYYFTNNTKDDDILPFDISFYSEVGKFLPIKDYSHLY